MHFISQVLNLLKRALFPNFVLQQLSSLFFFSPDLSLSSVPFKDHFSLSLVFCLSFIFHPGLNCRAHFPNKLLFCAALRLLLLCCSSLLASLPPLCLWLAISHKIQLRRSNTKGWILILLYCHVDTKEITNLAENNLSLVQGNLQVLYDRSLSKSARDTEETTSCQRHRSIFQVPWFSVEAHGRQTD